MTLIKKAGYLLGLPIILLATWFIYTSFNTNFFIPKPLELFDRFVNIWFAERFFSDVVPSLYRLLTGLGISIVIGVLLGVLVGSVRWLRWLLEPLFEFIRAVP